MWIDDLAFGQSYEKEAIKLLGNGLLITPPPGKHSPWDFLHNGRAYEVKADRQTVRTGNLCIEYEHTQNPSGLSITEAEEWIYFAVKTDGYSCYKIPVSILKNAVSVPGVRKWHTDGGNSKFYLIPANAFESYKFSGV